MLEHEQSSVKETQKHSKSPPKRTYSFLPLLSKAFTIKRKKNRKDFIFTSFYLQQCLFEIPLQDEKKEQFSSSYTSLEEIVQTQNTKTISHLYSLGSNFGWNI